MITFNQDEICNLLYDSVPSPRVHDTVLAQSVPRFMTLNPNPCVITSHRTQSMLSSEGIRKHIVTSDNEQQHRMVPNTSTELSPRQTNRTKLAFRSTHTPAAPYTTIN